MNRLELLALAVGVVLRIVRYLAPRPLWLDEAMIALNVLTRSPVGLLHPLDHNQISPVGFLWGEWVVTHLFGTGEKALRLLPLIAAIVALIAFARLARRLLEPELALLATALAALSPLLIYYSAEVKSYGFDWLGAILVMHATLTLIDRASREAWIRWSLAAAFSAMVSTAAPFFVAGSALALLAAPAVRRDGGVIRIAFAAAPAALLFVGHLVTAYDTPSTTSFMKVFWTEFFLVPRFPGGVIQAAHFAREYWSTVLFGEVSDALPRHSMGAILACSGIGAITLGMRSLPRVGMLLAPAALVAVASVAKQWPLTPRLLLFAVPAVLITLPAGLGALSSVLPQRLRDPLRLVSIIALILAAAVGLPGTIRADARFKDISQALRVEKRRTSNATIYLSADLVPACTYYLGWHPDRLENGADTSERLCALRGARTITGKWPSFVGLPPGLATQFKKVIVPEWLDAEGRQILDQQSNEVWLLFGNNREVRSALPAWLEAAGMSQFTESEVRGIQILGYRRN